MNRTQRKFPILLLAAGIAGGIFVAGCSSKDVRQETVATVNGDEIKGTELREVLGAPAGVFAVVEIPVERKKEALDQLVAVRLLAQEGRSRGIDNTSEYKEILERNDQMVRIKALLRKEIEAKLKVTGEEIKAEIAKVKEANKGISDADAAMRAVKSVSGSRIQKIQEDLIAAAKKETAAAVDPKAVARIEEEEDVPDNVVLATVGDEKILYGDFKRILRDLSPGRELRRRDFSNNPALVGNILETGNNDAGPCCVREEAGVSTAPRDISRRARRWSGSSSGAWWPKMSPRKTSRSRTRRSRRPTRSTPRRWCGTGRRSRWPW